MHPLKNLIDLLPKKYLSDQKELDEKTVFHVAKRIVIEEYGLQGAENITPVFYRGKKLFLNPTSSLWANEVFLQRDYLRTRINTLLGSEAIVEIKLSRQ